MLRFSVRMLPVLAFAVLISALLEAGWADESDAEARVEQSAWSPAFYALCIDTHDAKHRTMVQQADMLRELGFDGAGYGLWLGDRLDENLRIFDQRGLKIFLLYTSVDVDPEKPPYDPRLPEVIRKLKGHPTTVCVLMRGFPPGDPRGVQPAIRILRTLGDVAAEAGVRISIYHHTNDWTERLPFALRIVKLTNHPRVGVNFNLCHWLKVEGEKDYRDILCKNSKKIFAVTINGAEMGATQWTGGLIQPLDCGNFDNRRLLKILREIGYRGPVGLMCYGIPGDVREHLQRSMAVWKTLKEPD